MRECRQLTGEELARLAPNMRQQLDCPRERVSVLAEMELDGERIHQHLHPPTGLWSDGPSAVYERFAVAAGPHELVLRLRDSRRESGFDYEHRERILLAPQQHLVIDFRGDRGGFVIR